VPERQEMGDSDIQVPRKCPQKLVCEGKEPSQSIFFSSLLTGTRQAVQFEHFVRVFLANEKIFK
jgi:hypothetical protein